MHSGAGERFAVHETAVLRPIRGTLMAVAPHNFAMKYQEHPRHLKTISRQPPDAVPLKNSGLKSA